MGHRVVSDRRVGDEIRANDSEGLSWPPPLCLRGEKDSVTVGTRLFTVKFTVLEVPPPGAGLVTATPKVPPVARSLPLSVIVNWVELRKVGV